MTDYVELPSAIEQRKREQAIAIERRRWWELRETYSRCVQIAYDEWGVRLNLAAALQEQIAKEMRDRTAPGMRATGKEYDMDRSIPVPLFTSRDRLQFLKETSVTLFIEACKKSLPVTPEGKRAAQKMDATEPPEAGSGADETDSDAEIESLAQAGETVVTDNTFEGAPGAIAVSEAPAS